MRKTIAKDVPIDPSLPTVLRQFVSNTCEPMIVVKGDTIVEANDTILALFDIDRKSLVIGRTTLEFFQTESAERARGRIAQRKEGKYLSDIAEYTVVGPSGKQKTVEASVVPWPGDEDFWVVLVRDITQRKINEQKLHAATNELEAIIRAFPDMHFILKRDGTVIDYRSGPLCKPFAPPSEFIGKKINGVLPDEAVRVIVDTMARAIEQNLMASDEYALPMPDGIRHYEARIMPFLEDQLIGVVRDITERARAEEALRSSEERYRGIIESQLDLIVRVSPDNHLAFVNDSYCKMFGKTRKELIGSSFVPLIHQDDVAETLKAMEKLSVPPYRCYIEQRAMTVDGWKWLAWEDYAIRDTNGNIVEIQGVGRDITVRKLAEQALRESEAKYKSIVENSNDVIMLNAPDGTISYISPACLSMTGYTPEELIGHKTAIFHPADNDLVMQLFDSAMRGKSGSNCEYRIITKTGETKWISHSWSSVMEGDKLRMVVSVVRDIDEHKNSENVLRKAHADLERAYELQREFLNNITHEVRTPLTAVQGYVKMLLEGIAGEVNPEQAELLGRVLTSSDHLLEIVSGVLEIARIKSGRVALHPKACNPCKTVDKAMAAVIPEARSKGLIIESECAEGGRMGYYDEEKILAILTNLLSNSVKFTESGCINVLVDARDKYVEMVVIDTGMGIKDHDLTTVFDEFKQLDYPRKHKPKGFGIGLAIVATIIESLDAELIVSSAVGVGTAFTLRIPTLQL